MLIETTFPRAVWKLINIIFTCNVCSFTTCSLLFLFFLLFFLQQQQQQKKAAHSECKIKSYSMSSPFIWIIHICMTQKLLNLIHHGMLPKIHSGKFAICRERGMLGFQWLVVRCTGAVRAHCHPVKASKNYKPSMSHSCSPTAFLCPAAEGPGLGNKLVSFNIHNWWKAISRSVKMGLKGLCRRCA